LFRLAIKIWQNCSNRSSKCSVTNCWVSDGQQSIPAVKTALPEVAHALCHFHYLREAAKEFSEADRTKKELKRKGEYIEHSVSNDDNPNRSRAGIVLLCVVR